MSVTTKTIIVAMVLGIALLPLRAENITFADANVKALCLANWNTDGDNELSMEEAKAVTSLGTVFREKTNIETFNELKYFTGLTAIEDYAFYKSSIKSVTFPKTVTTIGEYAFSQSSISGDLHIPGTVKNINHYAFYSCFQLNAVILEEGVETVGWHAFSGLISVLSLPQSIQYLNSTVIDPYVSSSSSGIFIPEGDLYVYSLSKTPPSINNYAFYYVFAACHLVVPFGCIEVYKSSWPWSHFREYLEAGDVNGDGQLNVKDVTTLNAYIMGNRPTPFNERLADVNGDGNINVKDVTLMCSWIMQQGQQQEQ